MPSHYVVGLACVAVVAIATVFFDLLSQAKEEPQRTRENVNYRESAPRNWSNRNTTEDCSICLFPLAANELMNRKLTCGHILHQYCFEQYVKSVDDNCYRCPVCRKGFSYSS